MATIKTVTNLIQDINRSVSGILFAPDYDNYRFMVQTRFQVPLAYTLKKNGTWGSQLGSNKYSDIYEVTVLQEAIAQSSFNENFADTHNLLQLFREKYLDEATYVAFDGTRKVLSIAPRVFILDGNSEAFTDTGHLIIEYPERGDKFYWGFRFRFTVISYSGDC